MEDDAVRTRYLQNIHELQPAYRAAEEALKDFGALREQVLYTVWQDLGTYHPGDDPHKAVYLLAKCHTQLGKWAGYYKAIAEYQDAQKKLEDYDMKKAIQNG